MTKIIKMVTSELLGLNFALLKDNKHDDSRSFFSKSVSWSAVRDCGPYSDYTHLLFMTIHAITCWVRANL